MILPAFLKNKTVLYKVTEYKKCKFGDDFCNICCKAHSGKQLKDKCVKYEYCNRQSRVFYGRSGNIFLRFENYFSVK